jgi:hypothetical protein
MGNVPGVDQPGGNVPQTSDTGVVWTPAEGPPKTEEVCVGAPTVGEFPLRRLTRAEYVNTVRELFGTLPALPAFTPEEQALGFDNNAEALTISQLLLEQYQDAAERISVSVTATPDTLTACVSATTGERACAKKFIETFGPRAYRRPLLATEVTDLMTFYDARRSTYDYRTSLQLVIQTMLLSPKFLYRVELSGAGGTGVVALTPYELATRLSYLLWGSMPDAALFQAAKDGRLTTKEDVAAQARRMLKDAKAKPMVAHFHEQWLMLQGLPDIQKNTTIFPAFTDTLPEAMRQETKRFVEEVLFVGDGKLTTLLTANWSMLNPELASLYGAAGPASGYAKVALDGSQRSGLLTQASVLATQAKINQTAPVLRGKFVREQLLCNILPPPPPDVDTTVPEPTPDMTTRERFKAHSASPACSGCHSLMDPIGFGMENYDGIGRFRTMDGTLPVDASGQVNGSDIAGGFNGLVELGTKLAQSAQVRSCVEAQWFRFAFGRAEEPVDTCSIAVAYEAFEASGYDVRELWVGLTQTDAFFYRKASEVKP